MQVLHGIKNLSVPLKSSVVTIGNFDGVHRGHQELISRLVYASQKYGSAPVAFTFNPHPAKILTPDQPVARLFDFEDQQERLELLGVEMLIIEPFDETFSQLDAKDFFENYLRKPLAPKAIVVGYDFAFGRDRSGDHDYLKKICDFYQIELIVVPPLKVGTLVASSTQIREALSRGQVEIAQQILGRAYSLKGDVKVGFQRGRQIGVPTANLRPLTEFTPKIGVYVSRTQVGSQIFQSITNLGVTPTFQSEHDAPLKVETHLFNFAGDLYGRSIRVELLKYLREEKKFNSVDELKAQIQIDMQMAKSWFHEE